MVNFGLLTAEICLRVWGTPANFNGFRVLAALLHGTLVLGVSQTLLRWTEGATCIRQGGYHVGHWPTFLVSLILVEIGMLWLFDIFCNDAPIACPLLERNSVVHSPSSVIRDTRYGNVFTCANCSFWMSMRHAMPSIAITLVLSIVMSRLYMRLTRSKRSSNSCNSACEVANRMMSSA